jgi:hypothetical protein
VPASFTAPSSYTISGPLLGASTFTALLVSATPWTSGKLDAYLGISASPANPIGAYLPATNTYQPTATGFFVYRADLGTRTLPSNSGASDSYLMTLSSALVQGSYVVAYLSQLSQWGATANSGAILETALPNTTRSVPEPATWAMMIAGFAMPGAAARKARRKAALQ